MNKFQKDFKKIIDLIISEYPTSFYEEPDLFKNIKELIDKQTPTNPILTIESTYCKSCGLEVDCYDKHCKHCGQKLDWEETK